MRDRSNSSLKWKVITEVYLFTVALFLYSATLFLINGLIILTLGSHVGSYFVLANPIIDRAAVYMLGFTVMLYGALRGSHRFIGTLFLGLTMSASYVMSTQIIDTLAITMSFLVMTWLLTNPRPIITKNRNKSIFTVTILLLLINIILELLSLIIWLVLPVFPTMSQTGVFRYVVDLETKIFLLAGSLAPMLILTLLFAWIAKPFAKWSFVRRFSTIFKVDLEGLKMIQSRKALCVLLLCSFALAFLVSLYLYLPGLNPDGHPIGVDTPLYEDWLSELENRQPFEALAQFLFRHPDRPLTLFALYLMKRATGLSALAVAKFFPLLLSPILVLSVYFFARKAFASNFVSVSAGFFAVSSFHVSVGLYAGFLANWVAIIESYLLIGFLSEALTRKSLAKVFVASLFSVLLLFTHAGTWGMILGILFIHLVVSLTRKRSRAIHSPESLTLLILVVFNLAIGIARNYALGLSLGNFETLREAQVLFSLDSLRSFWNDMLYALLHTMNGFFINPLALFLATLGGLVAVLNEKPLNRYLTSWLICSSIFFVFSSSWGIKTRILFNMPLPVFEALGLAAIIDAIERYVESDEAPKLKWFILILVFLISLNYIFRCAFAMSQLVYDLFQ